MVVSPSVLDQTTLSFRFSYGTTENPERTAKVSLEQIKEFFDSLFSAVTGHSVQAGEEILKSIKSPIKTTLFGSG